MGNARRTRRRNVGEYEVVRIEYRRRRLGGQVRGAIGVDGSDVSQPLGADCALHLVRQHANCETPGDSAAKANMRLPPV